MHFQVGSSNMIIAVRTIEYSLIESSPMTVTWNPTFVGLSPIFGGLILSYNLGSGMRSENIMGFSVSCISSKSSGLNLLGGSSVETLQSLHANKICRNWFLLKTNFWWRVKKRKKHGFYWKHFLFRNLRIFPLDSQNSDNIFGCLSLLNEAPSSSKSYNNYLFHQLCRIAIRL